MTTTEMPRDNIKARENPAMNGKGDMREQLYSTFNDALDKTKAEVKMMQEKLNEYDEKLKASETVKKHSNEASEYMKSTLEEIKATLEALREKARLVFVDAKELSAEVVTNIWEKLNENIEKLKQIAKELDEKYQVKQKVTDLVAPLVELLNQLRTSIDQGIDSVKDMSKSGRSYLVGTAASLELKYHIESKLTEIDQKYKITETAKGLQEKGESFIEEKHLKEKVKELDEKLTGSKATTFIEQSVNIVKEQLEKVQLEYESAKHKDSPKPPAETKHKKHHHKHKAKAEAEK